MDVLEKFGVEWTLTAAYVINFLVILYILRRYLYKPLFSMLKKREETIKEGLEKAEEGKKELEKALEKERKIIKEAQDTAKKIIQDAKEQAQATAKDIEEKAKKQSDRMFDDAKAQIELEARSAEKELNKYVSRLSVELLKKSLPDAFTEKEQSEIVTRAVKAMDKKLN